MLHTQTVERRTLELLKDLMKDPYLDDFALAGGTALALYMGHRKSIDLDLFSPNSFDSTILAKYLGDHHSFRADNIDVNTLKGSIENIKVDVLTFDYPIIAPLIKSNDIRLYSKEDIAAMKLLVIVQKGHRVKDFIDIACLSTKMSLDEMLDGFEKKFQLNPMTGVGGLTFHKDINHTESIYLLGGEYSWKQIQKRLQDMVDNRKRCFDTLPILEKKLKVESCIKSNYPRKPIVKRNPPKKKKGRGGPQ